MVLIEEGGKVKCFFHPEISSPTAYILNDHGDPNRYRSNVGSIKSFEVGKNLIKFTVSMSEEEFNSCEFKNKYGNLIEILGPNGRTVGQAMVRFYKKTVTFGWKHE